MIRQYIDHGVVISLGIFLNTVTILMILFRTEQQMRIYSRILLQTCVCDVVTLLFVSICQHVSQFSLLLQFSNQQVSDFIE